MPQPKKKLVFYVDTECSFHSRNRCSYYSSKEVQRQTSKSAEQVWGSRCCPIVYARTGPDKYTAFCPTKGGPWGEQLPTISGPGPNAVKVELQTKGDESWAEIIEMAARRACEPEARECKR